MDHWLIWLILAGIFGFAEMFSLTTALSLLGGAALITAGTAALGLPLPIQLLVFTAASTLGIVLIRPIARRHAQPQLTRFGVDALIGKPASVIQDITEQDGRIRIGGEEWSARTYDTHLVIPTGTTVDVLAVHGSIAVVYPQEGPWTSLPR